MTLYRFLKILLHISQLLHLRSLYNSFTFRSLFVSFISPNCLCSVHRLFLLFWRWKKPWSGTPIRRVLQPMKELKFSVLCDGGRSTTWRIELEIATISWSRTRSRYPLCFVSRMDPNFSNKLSRILAMSVNTTDFFFFLNQDIRPAVFYLLVQEAGKIMV